MPEIIFSDKSKRPGPIELNKVLGRTFPVWDKIIEYSLQSVKHAEILWNFSGPNYGWSLRIKYKKRILVYLLPKKGFFIVSFVFGEKAVKHALDSDISENVKSIISSAKTYAEGRGFRIEIKNNGIFKDIKRLIDIKLSY